jgi:hypothetical protein
LKPESEVVTVEVPPLIHQATFDAVQAHLKARNPKVLPPRVVTGPTLTGICFCGHFDGAMTIGTGKGGRHRYYACSIKARQGETGCAGQAIPMDKLDTLVAGYIEERLLAPERLEEVLASVIDRRQDHAERRREHIAELNKRAAEAELRLKRLSDAVEAGAADLDDPALKDRIAGLKATRDQAQAALRAQARERHSSNRHTAGAPAVRQQRPEADAGRWGRLPPRLHPVARSARRGRGQGGPHHGVQEQPAANLGGDLWLWRKIGYSARAQFCSEMAEQWQIAN